MALGATLAGCNEEPPAVVETGPPEIAVSAPSTMSERASARVSAHPRDQRIEIERWRWALRKARPHDVRLEPTTGGEARLVVGDLVSNITVEIAVVAHSKAGFETTEVTTVRIEEVDAQALPRDPERAGRESLLGIDSNHNAIRDDVERAIYERHRASRMRMDLLGMGAQATQRILAASVRTGLADEGAGEAYQRFTMCMVNYSGVDARAEMGWLREQMLDNAKRRQAWEKHAESERAGGARVHEPVTREQCMRGQGP